MGPKIDDLIAKALREIFKEYNFHIMSSKDVKDNRSEELV